MRVLVTVVVSAILVLLAQPVIAASVTGRTAVRTQLEPEPRITGVTPLAWIPANTTLTLQCLTTGEKAYGAVAKADPYYYKVTYNGVTGYLSDSDTYTAKDAPALGLASCSKPAPTLPAKPGSPSVGSPTTSSLVLSWRDASNNETGFKTQYSTDGGKTWKAGPTAASGATSIKITGLSASKKYTFQVGASNGAGTHWSAYATGTTSALPTLPTQPGGPSAGSVTSSSVVLSWRDASNNETGFKTQYSTDGGKTWTSGPTAGSGATSIKIAGLGASKKYTFQVGATNSAGTRWSAYATATTAAAPVAVKVAGACNAPWPASVARPTTFTTVTISGWRVPICGPRAPAVDDGKHNTEPYPGFAKKFGTYLLGYQCTELANRWLYHRLGSARLPVPAGGELFASANATNYGSKVALVKNNGTAKAAPSPGDLVSFLGTTSNPSGHVALVYKVDVNSSGNGTIEIVEQNGPGQHKLIMKNWVIQPDAISGKASNWLHIK